MSSAPGGRRPAGGRIRLTPFQIVLVVLLVAIVGATAGYLLVRPVPAGPVGAGTPSSAPATPSGTASPAPAPVVSVDRTRRCLAHTEQLAHAGPLFQVLYLHTRDPASGKDSEVWICVTDDGRRLFYQGHRGRPQQPLNEDQNALFLTEVSAEPAGGYLAVSKNPSTGAVVEYHVDATRLWIHWVSPGSPGPTPSDIVETPVS